MTTNPFHTLGLPLRFALSGEALDAAHRELSKALHPDRHSHAPAGQRRRALSEAISVNDAYRLLKDPVRRAQNLLQQVADRAGLAAELAAAERQADPDFLMEMMELRESLAATRQQQDLAAAKKLASDVCERRASAAASLALALDQGMVARELQAIADNGAAHPDETPARDIAALSARLTRAAAIATQLRYFQRFLDEVAAIEDELD